MARTHAHVFPLLEILTIGTLLGAAGMLAACSHTSDDAESGAAVESSDGNIAPEDQENGGAPLGNESARFAALRQRINAAQAKLRGKNDGHADRGFHKKPHLCAPAKFEILDGVKELGDKRAGLFAEDPGTKHDAFVRMSNGVGFAQHDAAPDERGLAIKVVRSSLGQETLLDNGDTTSATQDFLMTNRATTIADSPEDFMAFGEAIAGGVGDARNLDILGALQNGSDWVKEHSKDAKRLLLTTVLVPPPRTLLGERYWSRAPIAMGLEEGPVLTARAKTAIKYSAQAGVMIDGACVSQKTTVAQDLGQKLGDLLSNPVGTLQDRLTKTLNDPLMKDYLREDLASHFAKRQTLCADLFVQVQKPGMPIETPTKKWREADLDACPTGCTDAVSKPIAVARVTIEGPASAAQEASCNQLRFSPWHAAPEHRPLGAMNRARKEIYDGSAQLRQQEVAK